MIRKAISLLCAAMLLTAAAIAPAAAQKPGAVQSQPTGLSVEQEKQMLDAYMDKFYEEAARIRGVKLVLDTETVDLKELPVAFAKSFYNLERYERRNIPFALRYAAVKYKLAEENRYALNGINYRIVVFVKENGTWKVDDVNLTPVDLIYTHNIGFGTEDEKQMAEIFKKRALGIYVNREGKVIDKDNTATKTDLEKELKGEPPKNFTAGKWSQYVPDRLSTYYKRPQTIKVLLTTPENKQAFGCKEDCVQEIDFLEYSKTAFALTWPSDAPQEALKAGALAVKMYGWFSVVVDPTAHRMNADVIDTDRNQLYKAKYVPKDEAEKARYEKLSSVFHAADVAGIGFRSAMSSNLFLPEVTSDRSLQPATGFLSIPGAVELANQGKDAAEILQHYFEGSDRLEEAVDSVTFFRYAAKK